MCGCTYSSARVEGQYARMLVCMYARLFVCMYACIHLYNAIRSMHIQTLNIYRSVINKIKPTFTYTYMHETYLIQACTESAPSLEGTVCLDHSKKYTRIAALMLHNQSRERQPHVRVYVSQPFVCMQPTYCTIRLFGTQCTRRIHVFRLAASI